MVVCGGCCWLGIVVHGWLFVGPNLVVAEVLVRMVGMRTKQQMVHINDGYLGLCLCVESMVHYQFEVVMHNPW